MPDRNQFLRCAKIVRCAVESIGKPCFGSGKIARTRSEFPKTQSRGGAHLRKTRGSFVFSSRMSFVIEAIVSEAQVVSDLRIGSIARLCRLQKCYRVVELQQRGTKAARRQGEALAVRECLESVLIVFRGNQQTAIEFVFAAKFKPIVLRALGSGRNKSGLLRPGVNFRLGRPIVFAFGLREK